MLSAENDVRERTRRALREAGEGARRIQEAAVEVGQASSLSFPVDTFVCRPNVGKEKEWREGNELSINHYRYVLFTIICESPAYAVVHKLALYLFELQRLSSTIMAKSFSRKPSSKTPCIGFDEG